MTKKQLPYCPAWTPTPTGDGGRFYCIQPEGHGGQHISPTANADAVRHDLEWVIYGTSEGQEIVDLRDSLATEKVRADAAEAKAMQALALCCSDRPGSGFVCYRSDKAEATIRRLECENAAMRKVIEAARRLRNDDGCAAHQRLLDALAELDAGEGG